MLLLLMLGLFTLFRLYHYRLNMKRKLAIEHEQSQRLMELNEIKARLFTNIAHEFRTPLTLIKGPAQLIEFESGEPETRERASMISGFTGKMLQLVNELLHIGRMEAGVETIELIEGDIALFIQNIAESFHSAATENNIRISFQSSQPEFTCMYDEEKLHKVAINLLSNAIKFTPPGGSIHIGLQFQGDSSMVFIVRDEGIGITEAHLPHIFKRYYQAGKDSRGSGIGLTLVKEIVDLLKGNIQVESQVGKEQHLR
jgi:signal transduction histidine kinase